MRNELLYLSRADVESVEVGMSEIISAVEEMFHLKGEGKVEMPPKPGVHTRPDSFIHAMPAYIQGEKEAVGMKWVGGYPANSAKNLPYITGLFILNDPENGLPICVMDCAWLTAMRTGAATAVAAKYLARPESKTLGIIGCGVQGRSNLLALKEVFSLDKVIVHDKFEKAATAFKEEMGEATGLDIEIVSNPRDAVSGMDLIVTAGVWSNNPLSIIQPDWMDEGAFASPVDMDSYWSPESIKEADVFCLDDLGQFENFSKHGCFKDFPYPDRDLGSVVCGKSAGRSSASQRIIGLNIGMALDDVAVAPLIHSKALDMGVGTVLPL